MENFHAKGAKDAKITENEIGTIIVDSAYHLHKSIGPGLLESVYEVILMRILSKKGLMVYLISLCASATLRKKNPED